MIFKFTYPQNIYDMGPDSPRISIIRSIYGLTEIHDLVERIGESDDVAEFSVDHQPHFKLFHSSYEPILDVHSANDSVLECSWSPGNMTKYDMVISLMPHKAPTPLLTWLDCSGIGGKSVLLVTHDHRYLMGKMGLKNKHDFLPMMDLVYLLGLLDIKSKRYRSLDEGKGDA